VGRCVFCRITFYVNAMVPDLANRGSFPRNAGSRYNQKSCTILNRSITGGIFIQARKTSDRHSLGAPIRNSNSHKPFIITTYTHNGMSLVRGHST